MIINSRESQYMLNLIRQMSSKSILKPPECVKNLTKLDTSLFLKLITVPGIQIEPHVMRYVQPILKKYSLKVQNSKLLHEQLKNDVIENKRLVLFDPNLVTKWDDLLESEKHFLNKYGLQSDDLQYFSCRLQFMNYSLNDILKAILPVDHVINSFTQIGHLVHVNLKDHLVAYRYIIGEVLLAKIVNCKTVVYKSDSINNTYRNFKMEILCGDPNTIVTVRNNRCIFEFDFAKVYWNSRLGTEHERILNYLKPGHVLYDIFAGVGPFSVPAAKKGCHVIANDLNPDAFHWLDHNCKQNKVNVSIFNKDAASFIQNELKLDLVKRLSESDRQQLTIHIVMNLPASAVEFLSNFAGLLTDSLLLSSNCGTTILLHVYCFIKAKENCLQLARDLVEEHLRFILKDEDILEIIQVRTVSNFKEMIRVSFKIDFEYLIQKPINNKRSIDYLDEHFNRMRPNLKSELDKVLGLPHVSKSIKIIEDCFQSYKLNEMFVCFNGGKDCTVLLILVIGTLQKLYDNFNEPLLCMYAQSENPFQEIEDFIEMCRQSYNLNIMSYSGGIKESLKQMLAENVNLKTCFAGTRRSDPFSENLDYLQKTDNDWPQIIRVSPLLDWTYSEIWDFLNLLKIPYCVLYDQGYTSLGSQDNTVPNPILKLHDMNNIRYLPAYKLQDGKDERAGRILKKGIK